MLNEGLKGILFTAGILIGIPVFPDWGIQFATAFAIGMLLPEKIINPINNFLKALIPPIKIFEEKLKKYKRFRTIIPRIIAGYFFTFLIGVFLIVLSYFL